METITKAAPVMKETLAETSPEAVVEAAEKITQQAWTERLAAQAGARLKETRAESCVLHRCGLSKGGGGDDGQPNVQQKTGGMSR